ncbi:MAG: helix-turn-helix transcriptional regulator [Sphingobacteriales bacterium]|nr:helix-turn-helix transcriptional regulator [Sphingobacteriales bacterium]
MILLLMYGQKIRLIRTARGMGQEEMARRLGITQSAYSKIENNGLRIDEETLEKIARQLGVSPEDIKAQEPVIINFQNSPQSSNSINGNVNYHTNEKIIEQLTHQLETKDKQIEQLLSILPKKQSSSTKSLFF